MIKMVIKDKFSQGLNQPVQAPMPAEIFGSDPQKQIISIQN